MTPYRTRHSSIATVGLTPSTGQRTACLLWCLGGVGAFKSLRVGSRCAVFSSRNERAQAAIYFWSFRRLLCVGSIRRLTQIYCLNDQWHHSLELPLTKCSYLFSLKGPLKGVAISAEDGNIHNNTHTWLNISYPRATLVQPLRCNNIPGGGGIWSSHDSS